MNKFIKPSKELNNINDVMMRFQQDLTESIGGRMAYCITSAARYVLSGDKDKLKLALCNGLDEKEKYAVNATMSQWAWTGNITNANTTGPAKESFGDRGEPGSRVRIDRTEIKIPLDRKLIA